jgi:hypothetical protein
VIFGMLSKGLTGRQAEGLGLLNQALQKAE